MTPTNRPLSLPVDSAFWVGSLRPRHFQAAAAILGGLLLVTNAHGLCPGEMEKASKMRQRIVREWPLHPNSDQPSVYLQNLGLHLAGQSGVGGQAIPWRFSLVRNLAPNAFSIGAGNIFVNEGAINFAQNESELAAILAHEIAHELAGHFCDAPPSGSSLFDIFSTPEPRQYSTDIGSLTQVIDPVKERQADQIALGLLRSAGFDPRAMLDVARRLPAGGAVHLLDSNRIYSLEQAVAAIPPMPSGSSEDFRTSKRILASEWQP